MKSFEKPALEMVQRIIEEIDDDEDFGDDIKDVSELGQENFWYQVAGDANPWEWGGSWFNPAENEIIHFDGIDQDGTKEIDSDKVEVPPQVTAKIYSKLHDPYLDTPECQEDPAHYKWMKDREDNEIYQMTEQYKIARAEFLNNRLKHRFYRIHVVDESDYIFRQYNDKVKAQFDPETAERYDSWPVAAKLIEIGQYIGFHEIGDQIEMSYQEAKALLGGKL